MVDRSIESAEQAVTNQVKQKIDNQHQSIDEKGEKLKGNNENHEKINNQENYHIWNRASKPESD